MSSIEEYHVDMSPVKMFLDEFYNLRIVCNFRTNRTRFVVDSWSVQKYRLCVLVKLFVSIINIKMFVRMFYTLSYNFFENSNEIFTN